MPQLYAPVDFFPYDAPPVARHLKPLDELLRYRGYSFTTRQEVLRHAGQFGTVECCSSLHDDDRADCEALLPRSRDWDRTVWDADRYELATQ